MDTITLVPRNNIGMPIEADVISPDVFANKTLDEIKSLLVWQGNTRAPLSEFFDIIGAPSKEPAIVINGDVSRVKYIGSNMSSGKITINGNVGMQLGYEMRGGEITVNGNADRFVGSEMKGGKIHIKGNAEDYIGCAYRGDWRGMRGGTIIIEGDAGNNIGGGALKGEIIIKGNVGQFCGINLRGGKIFVGGNAERNVGAEMVKGEVIICGTIDKFHPGFELTDEIDGTELGMDGTFLKFIGDNSRKKPKGVLYVLKEHNKHLIESKSKSNNCINDNISNNSNINNDINEMRKNKIEAIFNSGSTIVQGAIIKGGNKFTEEYVNECAVCYLHPNDYDILGQPQKVRVSRNGYYVVLRAFPNNNLQRGNIFVPRSIWANVIVEAYTEGTGSPNYKGGRVVVEPASDDDTILSAEDIIKSY
ncbi:formylmethanofuran dehydrogenase subunit C [Methanothermococcus okinawensis]|uniref:formylmethanofuran dehydrogenase n=1 Tax=Methanothermococcus okinawensis (strain DSM 14208 / JCM 11175 / IH1) TaxID=647113 RepID=F8AP00_METOI|nr:formylmethanofuran dehydrogenase subunit C [Methanothermococcus okinawensis]AEH07144.1 formylmethanofuran dehydrogenase subunit C [Methanothermococcus okinawensis IH1]